MTFDSSWSVVNGPVQNLAGGKVAVTGDSVTFMGTFAHNGDDFQVGPFSSVFFNNDVWGGGNFSGDGYIMFNTAYTVGNPGDTTRHTITAADDIFFVQNSLLSLRIGPFLTNDQLDVTDKKSITLADVSIVLDPGFTPVLVPGSIWLSPIPSRTRAPLACRACRAT